MAATNRKYLVFEGGASKVRDSQTDEIIFTSVRIGGASGKDITLVSGNFDFAGAKLVNLATPSAAGDAATKGFVEGLTDAIDTRLDTVETDLDAAEAAAVTLAGRVTTAEGAIDALEAADTAFDTRLDTVETDLDAAEAAAVTLAGRVTTAESDINALEAADTALDGRLDTIEPQIAQALTDIDAIEAAAVTLAGRVTTAESDIDALQAADTALDSRLDTAEADITQAKTDIDALEASTAALDLRLDDAETDIAGFDAKIEAVSAGYDPKASVDAAAATALVATYANGSSGVGATLTANANGALSIDGVTPTLGQRVLVMGQASAYENGIYDVTATGDGSNPYVLTRSADFDGSPAAEITRGARTLVSGGTSYAGSSYFLTTSGTIIVGVTSLAFSLASGPGVQATSASGGGIKGVLSADSDKGLLISSGVLEVKLSSELKFDGSGSLAVNYSLTKQNDNAGAVTVRQLVFVKSNGNVDLALAANASNDTLLGLVEDASIAAGESGKITLRLGAVVSGFTGLTPGKKVYAHNTVAGSFTQDASTIDAGKHLYSIGRALSSSQVSYDPQHIAEL